MRIPTIIAFVAIVGVTAFLSSRGRDQEVKEAVATENKPIVPAVPAVTTSTPLRFSLPALEQVKLLPIARELEFLNAPDARPEDDIELLTTVFTRYRKAFGQHPAGTNEEIVAALAGRNAKAAALISPEHKAIDEKGRLLDRWGTPYFFHQRSGVEMEIISAGSDRILFNEDDVVSTGFRFTSACTRASHALGLSVFESRSFQGGRWMWVARALKCYEGNHVANECDPFSRKLG